MQQMSEVTISSARNTARKDRQESAQSEVGGSWWTDDTEIRENPEYAQTRNAKPNGVNARSVADKGQAIARVRGINVHAE